MATFSLRGSGKNVLCPIERINFTGATGVGKHYIPLKRGCDKQRWTHMYISKLCQKKKKETSNVLTLSTLFGHLSICRVDSLVAKKKKKRKRKKKKKRKTRGTYIGSGRPSIGIVGDFRQRFVYTKRESDF